MLDAPKWSEIYKKHSQKMLGVCKRYINDEALAEDLMHEGFIAAMQKQNTFSGFGSFEGWLRTIMVNTALMHLRSAKTKDFASDSDIELVDNTTDDMEPHLPNDLKTKIQNTDFSQQELLAVINEIPEHHKAVFNMYVVDHFSHNQIAKLLNINVNTSKSHLLRARKKIQELLFLKASEKETEDKKDRKKGFFGFFAFSNNYIDKIYKKSFANYAAQPTHFFDIDKVISQQHLPSSLSSGMFFGVSFQAITIATIVVASSITTIVYVSKNNTKETKSIQTTSLSKDSIANKNQINAEKQVQNSLDSIKINAENDANQNALLNNKQGQEQQMGDKQLLDKSKGNTHSDPAKSKNKNSNRKVVVKKIIDTVYVYE